MPGNSFSTSFERLKIFSRPPLVDCIFLYLYFEEVSKGWQSIGHGHPIMIGENDNLEALALGQLRKRFRIIIPVTECRAQVYESGQRLIIVGISGT